MTHGHSLPEGFYEAQLTVIREGYPGTQIDPLTDAQLETNEHDVEEIAQLRHLQEIIRVTLENSGLLFEE